MADLIDQESITELIDRLQTDLADTDSLVSDSEATEAIYAAILDVSRHTPYQGVYETEVSSRVITDEALGSHPVDYVAYTDYKPIRRFSEVISKSGTTYVRGTDYEINYLTGAIWNLAMPNTGVYISYETDTYAIDLLPIYEIVASERYNFIRVTEVECPLGNPIPFAVWGNSLFPNWETPKGSDIFKRHIAVRYEAEQTINSNPSQTLGGMVTALSTALKANLSVANLATNSELEACLISSLHDMCRSVPLQYTRQYEIDFLSLTLDISDLDDFPIEDGLCPSRIRVVGVEYPIDQYPRKFIRFYTWDDKLYMDARPTVDSLVRVYVEGEYILNPGLVLYLAPGKYLATGGGHMGQGTIYKLAGGAWQLLAHFGRDEEADPDGFSDGAYVSCMFWDDSLGKLYAIPWYQDWVDTEFAPNPEPYDIYEVDTVTGEVTALGHSDVMRPVDEHSGYWNNPACFCQQAAKLGDYWFITGVRQEEYVQWPGYYYERPMLYKFDPVNNTLVVIDTGPQDHETSTYSPGVATDGTTLYWWYIDDDADNFVVYRKTANGVDFATDEEHGDHSRFPHAQMKYNPANGRFQVAAGTSGAPTPWWAKLLYHEDGSWVVDQVPGVAGDPNHIVSIGFRYIDDVPQCEYLLAHGEDMSLWPPANRQRVYSRAADSTGAFTEEDVAGLQGGYPVFNAFASVDGRVYCFKGHQVFYRDGDTGAWLPGTHFGLWENGGHYLWSGGPLVHGFCTPTSIPISEI